MSRKVFDYVGMSKIEVRGPEDLLERIAENIERETYNYQNPDCIININQSENPVRIEKDKRFPYLTIERFGTAEQPSIKYTRYNTPVRTIYKKSSDSYEVDSHVVMDESASLICIRNHINNHPVLSQYPLLHASLLNLNGQGILIPGNSRQGKTTLTVYLLQEYGASFVSDENVFLDIRKKNVRGLYVPRNPRVRFSTIAESGLSRALEDIELANATQYIDQDAIERIIATHSFDVEAGLAFSRKAFCNLLGTSSQESSLVNLVLFPTYKENGNLSFKKLGLGEGMHRLSKTGLMTKSDIDPKELQETEVKIETSKFEGIKFAEVTFSGIGNLRQRGFRL